MSTTHSSTGKLSQVTVRPATEQDTQGIIDCLHSAFARYRSEYTELAFAETVPELESMQKRMKEMKVLVATADGAVVGTLSGTVLDRTDGHLRGMAVSPEWQGSGIAAGLLVA